MQPDSSDAEIRAIARLPNLDIEIRHRPPRDGEGEQIVISLKAMPSFEAFGLFLDAANPLVFWAGLMQMVSLDYRLLARTSEKISAAQ